ncbi:hypothetical protein ECC02_002264 [Trypanosoma cruzi]|uniref:Uncharacterized protein n=1 Tax=Trypanosoma cruzi TaxID=5693 RepID=A0A7J6YDD1_TRYCR|nr:hypothetical protein ECC02_002264 [Trypanosoma cruzi]
MEFKQWVENRYRHPVVLVFASPMTEQACRRNGMDLVQMLRPFSVHPTELFAHIGDRADTVQVRKFGVRFTRLECVREVEALQSARYFRHLLRDHVAMELAYGEQLDRAMSSLLKENGGVVEEPRLSAQVASQLLERSHPAWYSQFIRDYAYVVRCSHFDTIDHPVGCIYAASTCEAGGIDGIMREFREQQKQPADTRRNMPCMDDELHSYFLLVHDITEGPPIEEVRRMLAAVKAQYGHAHCAVVKINSVVNPQDVKNMDPSPWIDANRLALDVPSRSAVHLAQPSQQTNQMSSPGDGVVRDNNNNNNNNSSSSSGGGGCGGEQKPVSGSSNATVNVVFTAENSSYPNIENSSSTPASLHFPRVHTMFGKWPNGTAKITGCHMSPEDVEGLRDVVTYYLSRCLFNFLERKLRVLVLTINEKRTTTFGKVAAWFRNKDEVKPKTDSWVTSHDGSPTKYLAGSLEMQMRRAADILLALADYDSAISYYRMCRNELLSTVSLREFNKPLIAACQEGIGVCEFLQGRLPLPSLAPWVTGGTSSKNSGDCRLEVAQNDYVECRVHTYAFRLSLMLYEYSRTRSPPALDRAAASLIHVQRVGIAYRNKLYSAILHELLASVSLFLNPPQPAGMTIPALLPNNFLLRSHVRQYARQMIIAGSAYLDDNLIENALRCYLRALRVCGGVGRRGSWQLIFEHIHTLLAHMYRKIGNQIRGMVMASIAVSMATPMYSNLRTGLRNFDSFWSRQRQVMENLGYKLCPHMVAPCILPESIRVSTNAFHCDEVTRQESQVVSDELAEVEWHKMEDKLRQHYTGYASSSPRHQLNFREEIGKTQRDNAVVCMRRYSMHLTEPLEITVTLRNPIGGPLTAEKLCLLYVAKQKPDQLWKSASSQTVELQAAASKSVTISFSPSEEGTYVIIGFCWTLLGLEGYYYFATETYKVSDDGGSDNRIGAFEYAVEHPVPNVNSPANMEIVVAPPQAWITARLDPELPPFMRDGEYCQTTLVLTNGSSYRTARSITLQRSPKNAHVVWMEPFGLERNIDAEATFVLEQELAPKTSLTLPMTVQAHHSQDSSSRCKNNVFFLVGYISGTAKEEDALPSSSSSSSFLASLRFHRFFRRVVVKSAILLSSMVLPPANVTMATAALITASNVSEAREPPVRVSRVMVIHRPRWRVVPTSLGNLLAENALDCILSSGGALCVPLSVVSETPSSKTTHTDATVVHSRKLIEEVCIPLSSTLAATSRRIMVEENIGAGVVDSEMNSYFMRCSFRGPGTIGEVKVSEGLPFYLDKAGAAGKSAGSDEGAAQKQEEQIYHPHHQQPQRHSTMVVPVVEPFTPICVAVVWAVEERGRMYSGQMFHFVDPVCFLSSCEFSVGEAHDRLQEHLCDSMIKDRTLHPHHGAMFYHVEVPHTVETTADSPDVAIIPVTVHCRSLAAHPLLVTVKTTTPGSPDALPSPMLSPVPLTFVGKTSVGFLLLPHETHLLNFTACAFAPGVAECNHFQVSAVALKLPQGETCGSWRTGTSQSALMKLLGENKSCLGRNPSMTAGVRGGEINVSGGDGNKCVSSGGKDHLGGVGDLVRDGVQTVILGHGMAAITRVLFVSLSAETRRLAAEAVTARARAYQEDAKIYEKQYREFEHRRALLNFSSGTTLQKADYLLVLYPPRARKLVERTQDTPHGATIAASIGSVGQPDPSPRHGDREILKGIVGSTSAVMLEAVGTTSSLVPDEVVEVVADVEGQENQEGLQNVAVPSEDTSKPGTDVSCSSTTSTDMSVEPAAEQNPNTSSEEVYHTMQQQ